MSLTQTTTTTKTLVETMSDLQRRLQPPTAAAIASATVLGAPTPQQLRFRGAVGGAMPHPTPSKAPSANATLTRRFSFVWPFISKETAAGCEPFLKSRCSQLLRQFPAFLSSRHDDSARTIRDLISRVLTQLKAVWLVLAVYLSLVVLTGLCAAVVYTFLGASKPPGLLFLVGCVAATGAIAAVSLSARERPQPRRLQQKVQMQVPPPQQPTVQLQVSPPQQAMVQLQVPPPQQPKVQLQVPPPQQPKVQLQVPLQMPLQMPLRVAPPAPMITVN